MTQGIVLSIITVVTDIISDLLRKPAKMKTFYRNSNLGEIVISIPLILLWKVKIKRQQKILVGIFLCLNVCMIIIAIIRVSGFVKKNTFDIVWISFWHHFEGAVAIMMVSLTAFRSMLGINALKAREKERMERSWFSNRPKLPARYFKKETQDESNSQQLPSIPGATLTGMRTLINDSGIWNESKAIEITNKLEKGWPKTASPEPQEFELAHLSTELEYLEETNSAKASDFV